MQVKLFPCLTNLVLHHADVWGSDVYSHVFLTTEIVGGEWSASRLGRFTPGERVRGTHFIGNWVSPRTGLEAAERRKMLSLRGLELFLINTDVNTRGVLFISEM
jgi:hypothetical protein